MVDSDANEEQGMSAKKVPKSNREVSCREENKFDTTVVRNAVGGPGSRSLESLPTSELEHARRKSVAQRLHASKSDGKLKSGWMWRWSKAAAGKCLP